ncbi:MAG TPA: DUF4869 domain-containing protein [Candidatus Mediterraneibacter intestinavium]|nr:DUF4869 domain-containing protein [Candidatus Mediterraneibacter intestinavium]
MLNIFYGDMPQAIYNTAVYFKNVYEEEWITQPLVKEMILDVDKSVVLDGGVIDSPVMGKIPPVSLSGGVKTLILISDVIKDSEVKEILNDPSDHIESSQYMSWERYFTELLTSKTEGTYLKYSKRMLNQAYLQENIRKNRKFYLRKRNGHGIRVIWAR